MVARHQAIYHPRQPLPVAPFHAGLADQRIYDVQRRVHDPPDVGQHVGHAHQMMVIVAGTAAIALARRQPEKVLQAAGDAHIGMVLDGRHRDHGIGLDHALHQNILPKELAAAGNRRRPVGRTRAVEVGDVELAQEVGHRHRLLQRAVLVHHKIAAIGADDLGACPLAQQAEHRPANAITDQLLALARIIDAGVGRLVLIELDDNAPSPFEAWPRRAPGERWHARAPHTPHRRRRDGRSARRGRDRMVVSVWSRPPP